MFPFRIATYLDIMRKDFKAIYEQGEMTNQGLKAWD